MNKRFDNKVCIITGAAQGIGRGVALRLASEGGKIVMVDFSPLVEEVLAKITANGGDATAIQVDLETYQGAKKAVEKALDTYGRIDVLVNNVGGAIWMKPFINFSEEEIQKEISRSLFPTLWSCHAVLSTMVEQQSGTIVNVSSIATRGINRIPYSTAKGGVNAMTASLAFEYANDGIRVNAVATGGTEAPPRKIPRNTQPLTADEKSWMDAVVDQTIDRTFMKRYGTINEQVNAIAFLASDESSYITGSTIPVGGGDEG
ncbi:1,6-dihydroxycyclohexa-2,4-diene-1-carboxylate dehydrogenase [Psychrobacter celer]|uniref:1,6-dihydroxycyclohexa-2,4-diene-1-carboxylate dehydrogenase n=1 Tax=Psychrobacter TaxID=497 RepID=UPI003FD18BC1